MKGLFITMEGGEGAGKTTQIKNISTFLKNFEIPFIVTREPGGTAISEKIRMLLLDKENSSMTGETEALLYAASRAQHIREKVMPALSDGVVVICDRFVDSSVVYQGYARGLGIENITKINSFATGGIEPDITFFLDVSPSDGLLRKKADDELDRLESESISFHEIVRNGYNALAEKYSERIVKIDGSQSAEEVWEIIKDVLNKLLNIN